MWIPAQTTVPPGPTWDRASGTSRPTGAKMIAASSGTGGGSVDAPAHRHPSRRANCCAAASPGEVNAYTSRPSLTATCVIMCAAAPNPYKPSRCASPAIRYERYPISPAHSSGAACRSSYTSGSLKA